jgi:MFS transporter, PPP family, 3-phenylpropionic acid transporter
MAIRLFYLLHFGAMGVYLPYFPVWLGQQGIDGARMSVVLALLPTLSVLSPSGFGALADAFGWRGSLLRAATLGALVSMGALFLAALLLPSVAFWVVFAATLGFGFFRTPMQLLSEVVALEQAKDYGRVRMWGSVGFMLVALGVGRLAPDAPLWCVPASIASLLFLTHLSSWRLPKNAPLPTNPSLPSVRTLLKVRPFQALLVSTSLGHASHVAYELCLSLHLSDLGFDAWIGAAWTIATFFEVVLLATSRHLFSRFPATVLLMAALLVTIGRWLFLWQVESLLWLMLMQPLHAITFGLRWLASISLVKRLAPKGSLATTQGLFLTATALGSAAGMLVWGTLYREIGSAVFVGAAAVGVLAAVSTLGLMTSEPAAANPP